MPMGIPTELSGNNAQRNSINITDCLVTTAKVFAPIALARKRLFRLSTSCAALFSMSPSLYAAIPENSDDRLTENNGFLRGIPESIPLDSSEVILLALFGGAMSFALMAAFWLIRERNRAGDEIKHLHANLAHLKAVNERNEALVNVADQRVVMWNGNQNTPVVLGSLSKTIGAPNSKSEFICFGKWMTSDSCKTFEKALQGLRKSADAFDMPLQTCSGGIIEAQGRTSGGFAFVRFIELSGERAALAHLETEHTRLLSTFHSIQSLFDRLDMPVWLSSTQGVLYWANKAYANAVEAVNSIAAVDNGTSLFDKTERLQIKTSIEKTGIFNGTLPAIISGDRKTLDIVEIAVESGGAGIAIDRSDADSIRNELKQTIESHSNTLDQLASAIAIFDQDKKLKFFNSSFQDLWNFDDGFLASNPSNADVLGAMREKKRLPAQPDWRKWRDKQLEIYQAIDSRQDWWHLTDGITLRVVVSPQTLGGATWIFEDVTEQLALRSNYNSIVRVQGETLDHLSEAVAVFGSDGKLRLSNPALEKLFNKQSKEIKTGIHISDLSIILSENLKSKDVWDDIVGVITGLDDTRASAAGRLYLTGGKIIDFALVPLPDGQTMLTLVDVTANVNIERALTERNDALEESDHLKNQFLQHVSYELRTPLTNISGFGELLSMEQTGKLNATQKDYLDSINASSASLKTIIDDILDLATIDAGAMELELRQFEVAPILRGIIESLTHATIENHVSINAHVAENANVLIADSTRFRQILYNLVTNAINHSPDGAEVNIYFEKNDNEFVVAVSDQGPGISIDERDKIFNRFQSMSKGDTRKGAGLGLSIVKSFVELHGGTVSIESAGKRGSKFVCSFPHPHNENLRAAQ